MHGCCGKRCLPSQNRRAGNCTSGSPAPIRSLAWVQAQLRPRDPADYLPGAEDRGFPSAEVFRHFEGWAKAAGYRPGLQVNSFVQRLRSAARYVRIRHTKAGNRLLGFIIGNPPDGDDDDDAGPAARE